MELKELVGEELATKLVAMTDETVKQAISKLTTAKLLVGDATSYVPKSEFNEKNDALKAAKELIKKHETDLEGLKGKLAGSESSQSEITRLQNENKAAKAEYESGLNKNKKLLTLTQMLINAGATEEDQRALLIPQFDIDKLEFDDKGELKGVVDKVNAMKAKPVGKGLFGTVVLQGQQHQDGSSATPISQLETKLADAQKRGKMVEVVAIRQQIFDEQHKE
jgi:hypothetical protein